MTRNRATAMLNYSLFLSVQLIVLGRNVTAECSLLSPQKETTAPVIT